MKNIIPVDIIKKFKSENVEIKDIVDFLDKNPEITISHFCKTIDFDTRKIYDYKFRLKHKINTDSNNDNKKNNIDIKPKAASDKYNRYTAEEKFKLVENYSKINEEEQGQLLRTYGLYKSDIDRWQNQIKEAAIVALGQRKVRSDKKSDDQLKIEELEKELKEQEKTTAKLSSIIVFQKKTEELFKMK